MPPLVFSLFAIAGCPLRQIPCGGIVVQGQQDFLCAPRAAWRLAQAWPGADLRMVAGGTHADRGAPMEQAMMAAVRDMVGRVEAHFSNNGDAQASHP